MQDAEALGESGAGRITHEKEILQTSAVRERASRDGRQSLVSLRWSRKECVG